MDILNQIHDFLAISHRLIINQVSFASIHVLWDWFSQKKVIENLDIIFQKNQTKKRICKDLKIIIRFCFLFELENRDSHSFLSSQATKSNINFQTIVFCSQFSWIFLSFRKQLWKWPIIWKINFPLTLTLIV